MAFVVGIKRLKDLVIDTAKDWLGYSIKNVGAPTTATDAARKQEVDAHASRTDNPHQVTAAQVGAVSKTGDDMGGNFLKRLMLALDAPHSGTVSPLLNDLAYAHATAGRTVTVSPAPTAGAVGNMFNENSVSYAEWSNTTPLPITVQIDFTFNLHYMKVFAISFPWSCSTKGVKIEVYDNSAATWVTVYDNASFSGDHVVVTAYRNYIRSVRFTFYGAYNSTALRVSRLVMTSSHYCGMNNTGYALSRGGGDVAGPITVQGNKVWHAGNDGAGSGLDADLVRGKVAAFAPYAGDETEVSVSGTTETLVKTLRVVKCSANGLNVTALSFVATLKVTGGTGYLRIYIDNTLVLTLSTTSTGYVVVHGNKAVSWGDNTVHTIDAKMYNSGAYVTYNQVFEVYVK